MAKRPAFQFYPSDWLNDLGLRQCSPMARGVWADLMCLMHDGEPYGYLATKSGELTIPWLANRLGMRKGILLQCMVELEKFHVFSRNSSGIVYSRRMVRDEQVRLERASGGTLSINNPNVPRSKKDTLQGYPEGRDTVPSPSSSSSSSSPSSIKPEEQEKSTSPAAAVSINNPIVAWFDAEFWPSWIRRKEDDRMAALAQVKSKAKTVAIRAEIMTGVHRMSATRLSEDPEFRVSARRWLKESLWKSVPETPQVGLNMNQPKLGFAYESPTARSIREGEERVRKTGQL